MKPFSRLCVSSPPPLLWMKAFLELCCLLACFRLHICKDIILMMPGERGVMNTRRTTVRASLSSEKSSAPANFPSGAEFFHVVNLQFLFFEKSTSRIPFHFLKTRTGEGGGGWSIFYSLRGIQIRGGNERLIWSEVTPLNRNADMIIKLEAHRPVIQYSSDTFVHLLVA